MSQWKKSNDSANSVKWVAESLDIGSGHANQASNNTSLFTNTTPGAFPEAVSNAAVGQFGVETAAMANTSGESSHVTHAGWVIRRSGMGGVASVTGAGSGYTNLATFAITAGTGAGNATAQILTTNSTGGILTIGNFSNGGGLFPNSSYINAVNPNGAVTMTVLSNGAGYHTGDILTVSNTSAQTATFIITANSSGNIVSLTVVSAGSKFTTNANAVKAVTNSTGGATGNGISSVTVTAAGQGYVTGMLAVFSNGTVNGQGTITANATGNITSVAVTTPGSGFAGPTNTAVTITFANGTVVPAATANGATLTPVESSATFSAAADSGTNANLVFTLGGRAGRVQYEKIVAMSSVSHGAGSNTTQLPIT